MSEFALAPLDRTTRVVTVVALAIVLGAMGATALTAQDTAGRAVATVLGPLVILLAWGFAPATLRVHGQVLEVRRRLWGAKRFTVTGPAHRPQWRLGIGTVRKLGSGGLFGWYGAFWKPGLGSFHAYLTDRANAVLCETAEGPVVVSPADPDALLAALAEVSP